MKAILLMAISGTLLCSSAFASPDPAECKDQRLTAYFSFYQAAKETMNLQKQADQESIDQRAVCWIDKGSACTKATAKLEKTRASLAEAKARISKVATAIEDLHKTCPPPEL